MSAMPKERKILLAAFFSILGIAAIIIVSNIFLPELRRLDRQIDENRREIGDLSSSVYRKESLETQIKALDGLIDAKKAKFYNKNEITPFLFADMIKNQLQKQGLSVSNFQMVSSGNESLPEFSVKGTTRDFIKFIEAIYAGKHSIRIPFLRITANRDGTCLVNMRIGYEEL